MNAIVSGLSGAAMVLNGNETSLLRVGSGEAVSGRPEDFPFVFGEADDLQFLEDVELPEVTHHLEMAFAREQSLQLALVLLDRGFSPRTRRAAAEELESLLHRGDAERFVESVLYAHVLPASADLAGALSCIPGDARRVRKLLGALGEHQGDIAAVQLAWEALPPRLFGGDANRSRVRAAAIRAGWFRELARWCAQGHGGTPGLSALAEAPQGARLPELLREWTLELRAAAARDAESREALEDDSPRYMSYVAEPKRRG